MSTQGKKVLRSRSRSRSRSPSPVRVLAKQKPVKTQNQIIKAEKRTKFNREVDDIIKDAKHLIRLSERYGSAKRGHELVFNKNGEERTLTVDELNEARTEYFKKLQTLKKLNVECSKNTRASLKPLSFKAAYTPSKVSNIFVTFFGPDKKKRMPYFGEQPNSDGTGFVAKSNLLDLLPRVREGYLLKNSLTLMINIYNAVNDLKSKEPREGQKNIPDERMNTVFGEMDALYYQDATDSPKILMTKSGKKLSTYAVVAGKNARFNPSKIENYYFQSILSLNVYDESDLSKEDISKLTDATFRQELLREFEMIERAKKLLTNLK